MSSTYYNEWDAKKAAWLEQLQKDGLLAHGITDTTDIRDVLPTDVAEFERVHFFAGIGGWEYACELAGWTGPIWTASCPCQPFSAAGKRAGVADERHLFPAVHWLIEQCRPPIIVGEQVASKDGLAWLDTVFARLEATGYTCAAYDLSAASVGAPHIRQRLYWVAYTGEAGERTRGGGVRESESGHDTSGGGSIERLGNAECRRESGDIGRSVQGDATGYQRGRQGAETVGGVPYGGLGYSGSAGPQGRGAGWSNSDANETGRLADTEPSGLHRGAGRKSTDLGLGIWESVEWVRCINPIRNTETLRPVERGSSPLAHGVPNRMVKIAGYGDAIVPQLAAVFLKAVQEELSGVLF